MVENHSPLRSLLPTFGYKTVKVSTLLHRHYSLLRRAIRRNEYFGPYKYSRDRLFFHLMFFLAAPLSFLTIFADMLHRSTSMALRKSTPAKRQRSSSTSQVAPPPSEDPHRFVSWEAERIYHESLFNRLFVQKQCFPTSNAFFNFTTQSRR